MSARLFSYCLGLILVLSALLSNVPAAEQVYDCNFQKSKAKYPEWSNAEVTQYSRRMRFLVRFRINPCTHAKGLCRRNQFVRLKFDLLVISSWDGSSSNSTAAGIRRGPDIFQLQVVNGPVLHRQTFCNSMNDQLNNSDLQSYPELDLRLLTAARTGGKTIEIEELQDNDDETGLVLRPIP